MNRARYPLFFACFALFTLFATNAKAESMEPDFQPWMQALIRTYGGDAAPGLRAELDLQARRMNAPLSYPEGSAPVQSPNTVAIVRPIVGYEVRPGITTSVGYVYQPNFFDDPAMRARRDIHEHRVFSQLALAHNVKDRIRLGTRARVEHRVRTHGPGAADGVNELSPWAHRLRLMERVSFQFTKERPFLFIAYSETFFHLNRTAYPTRPGFDQQRSFAGLGYRFPGGDGHFEMGYINQIVRRYNDPHQLNHVLFSGVTLVIVPKKRSAAP